MKKHRTLLDSDDNAMIHIRFIWPLCTYRMLICEGKYQDCCSSAKHTLRLVYLCIRIIAILYSETVTGRQ